MSGTGAINAEYPWLGIANAANIPASWPRTAIGVSSGASLIVRSYHSTGRLRFLPGDLTGAFTNGENVRIDGVTVGTASLGTSGLTRLADPSLVNYNSGGSVHDFDISYISASPIRVFTWRDLAIYQGTLRECGRQSHANAINFYEQCHNILVWGVNTETADGYATWQESDAIVLAFCAFSASTSNSGGHRAIAQQQGSHSRYPGEVFGHKKSAVLNCRTSPFPGRVASTKYGNGMDVTSSAAPLNRWTVYNNVHQGHNGDDFVAIDDWDYNFNTEPGGPGTGAVGPNDVVFVMGAQLYRRGKRRPVIQVDRADPHLRRQGLVLADPRFQDALAAGSSGGLHAGHDGDPNRLVPPAGRADRRSGR